MDLFRQLPLDGPGRCGDTSSYEVPEHYKFVTPTKCVKINTDLREWLKSQAYFDVMGFINAISLAVQGKQISSKILISKHMANLLIVFEKLNKLVDETPINDQPQRFGNSAFRTWYSKMNEQAYLYLLEALTEKYANALNELFSYFKESFGNPTRIDYGTGHELSFIMFLCGLFKVNALIESDSVACGLRLFNSYLLFVRRLQLTYRMEPAGSQGVWSLDDHQFVPYIWGSAQLALNSPFDPHKFLDDEYIEKYKDEYLFMSCIDYIKKVKTGHFAEHSNQLWSISAVQSWSKINSGLIKMYQKEILAKFPIVQHILFGSVLSFESISPDTKVPMVRLGLVPIPVPKPQGEPVTMERCPGEPKKDESEPSLEEGMEEVITAGEEENIEQSDSQIDAVKVNDEESQVSEEVPIQKRKIP